MFGMTHAERFWAVAWGSPAQEHVHLFQRFQQQSLRGGDYVPLDNHTHGRSTIALPQGWRRVLWSCLQPPS